MMKAWDGRDQARRVEPKMNERLYAGRPPSDPLDVVDYTPSRFDYEAWEKRMRAEDRIFIKAVAFATFLIGLGAGFVVGVWVATH